MDGRRRWILLLILVIGAGFTGARGAAPADRSFWSFQPLKRVEPLAVEGVENPVDRFVVAAQRAKGLEFAPEADRRTVVRRLYFDLLGLPPSPEQLDEALKDSAADGYERLVNALLASPHFGERWARHWLDVARYAESDGYEADADRPTAWHYRDFVIRAFNDDLPYDTFVKWQLAGDEYEPDNQGALAATGFLASATTLRSEGTKRELLENRYNELDDMVSTVGSAMLALTVGCARCHDHKYDPIPTQDYYRLVAAFASTARVPAPPKPVPGQVEKFKAQDVFGPALRVTDAGATPVTSHVLARGDVEKPSGVATAGVLSALAPVDSHGDAARWLGGAPPAGAKTTLRRRAVAGWMTDVESGAGALLARVIVNRLWQHHFGEGLVRTPGDFGAQGDRPSHPELLDWLASELVRGGWRLKPIHRLILTSRTYRQGTTFDAGKAGVDPEDRLLWRRRPRRVEAEVLRDSILAVSGQLRPQMYGPSVKPYVPPAAMAGRNKDGLERPKEDGPGQWRRSVYLFVKRSLPEPMLTTFDAPVGVASCTRRNTSTVPTQALALLNDPFVRRQAEFFAKRCAAEAPQGVKERVRRAYVLALAREPGEKELEAAVGFVGEKVDDGMTDLCQVLMGLNEFAYID